MKKIDLLNVGMITFISMTLYKLNELKNPETNPRLFQNLLQKENEKMSKYIKQNEKFLKDNPESFYEAKNYEKNIFVNNKLVGYFSDPFLTFHLFGFCLFLIFLNFMFPIFRQNVNKVLQKNYITSLSLFLLLLIWIFSSVV